MNTNVQNALKEFICYEGNRAAVTLALNVNTFVTKAIIWQHILFKLTMRLLFILVYLAELHVYQ